MRKFLFFYLSRTAEEKRKKKNKDKTDAEKKNALNTDIVCTYHQTTNWSR
jgi:hypothetical protein